MSTAPLSTSLLPEVGRLRGYREMKLPFLMTGSDRRMLKIGLLSFVVLSLLLIATLMGPITQSISTQNTAQKNTLSNGASTYVPAATNRKILNFDPSWLFYRGDVSGSQQPTFNDSTWEHVNLPHTVRLEPVLDSGVKNYQGIAWYRRHFALDSSYSGKKIFVRFEGAMQVADVWVNGTSLGEHQGGYTPFVFDITNAVKLDSSDNVIAVKLNNQDNSLVPPGKPESQLDFNYFGGLYRDVKMIIVDPLHITDANYVNIVAGGGMFVTTPTVSTSSATVQVKTNVQNDGTGSASATVKSFIVDTSNTVIATLQSTQTINAGANSTFVQSTTLTNPKLWSPDSPYLYTVYSEIDNGSTPVDNSSSPLGIRSINFSKANGFTLNGQRLILNGTNRHQEYPYVGYAVPASGAYRDALLIKEGGANFVRSSHYPPDPAFLEACDQLGLLVMDSIPGWQYFNSDTQFQNNSFNDVRQMIRRDRNHPSVILWEVALNETASPASYGQMTNSIAHAEYPGNQAFTYGGDTPDAGSIFDVQNQNYSTSGPAAVLQREYGDWEFGGNQSTSRTQRSDGEVPNLLAASEKQQRFSQILAPTSGFTTAGLATWSGFDYNRGYDATPAYSGLMDWFRLPKFSYYFYESQRDPNVVLPNVGSGPMIFIANWWTSSSPTNVTVYSNAEKVNLYLNNTLVASQTPDTGGYNAYVPHPPFTFKGVTWKSGTLRADGLINNKVVTSQTVSTPGAAQHVVVTVDTAQRSLIADGTDFAIVHASVVDQNGTVVPTNSTSITFSVSGNGAVIGDSSIGANPVTTGAGIASALVRTTTTAGQITITASANGLQSGNASVTSIPQTGLVVPLPGSGATPTPIPTPGTTPTPTPVGSGFNPNPNAHYTIVNRNSGQLLDVSGSSTSNGGLIDQRTNTNGANQQWSFVAINGGYKIVNANSAKLLEVPGSSTTNGTQLDQSSDVNSANQRWNVVSAGNGYYSLVNQSSSLYADVTGASTASGAAVIQWTNHNGTNQQWNFVQVS